MKVYSIILAGAAMLAATSAPASAATIFSSDMNSYTSSNMGRLQPHTGLSENFGGSLADWTGAGFNAVHGVDRGGGNWAAMLFGSASLGPNSITTKALLAANALGQLYQIDFASAAAAYSNDGEGTQASDDLRFSLVNGSGVVLQSQIFHTASWTASAVNPFVNGSISYVGDGTGDVRLQITGESSSNRFGGAIDNVMLSAVPEPASWAMMILGIGAVGFAMRRRQKGAARWSFAV